jgi:hypothetical protein
MSFSETHEMEGTLKECLRELVAALGHRDFEMTGDEVIVRDQDKRFVISLTYEGDRRLGSLDLPMTRVEYTCSGCTEAEAKEFQEHMAKHLMRAGGG